MGKKSDLLSKHYFIAFFSTLIVSIGLLVGSFILPPQNEITPSALKGAALTFLWPTLAFGAKAFEYGIIKKKEDDNDE